MNYLIIIKCWCKKKTSLYADIQVQSVDRLIVRPYFLSNHLWIAVTGIPFICNWIVCNLIFNLYLVLLIALFLLSMIHHQNGFKIAT